MQLNLSTVGQWIYDHTEWQTANEYGERGYGRHDTSMIVLGDYWLKTGRGYRETVNTDTHPERGHVARTYGVGTEHESTMRGVSDRYPRLFAQLESQGVEFEWHDEWVIDDEGNKCYRTSGDCYGWEPSTVYTEDGDLLTPDDDIETWIEWAINNTSNALTSAMVGERVGPALESAGWTQFAPDDPQEYASGWHPGQTDTPADVVKVIRAQFPKVDIVFAITDIGQFDLHFAAFIREEEGDDE